MAKRPQNHLIVATSKAEFDMTVQQYIGWGYGPRQITSDMAILFRPGSHKSLGCGFVFWLLVFFPIAIIMAVSNANQAAESTVTIRLDTAGGLVLPPPPSARPPMPTELTMSEDRGFWWDGSTWVSTDQSSPPMAPQAADGTLWWDGEEWRATR